MNNKKQHHDATSKPRTAKMEASTRAGSLGGLSIRLNSPGLQAILCAAALAGAALMPVPQALADTTNRRAPKTPAKPLVARVSALIPNAYLDANTDLAQRAIGSKEPVDPDHPGRYFVGVVPMPDDDLDPHRFTAAINHRGKFYELHVSLKKEGEATRLDAVAFLRPELDSNAQLGKLGPQDIQGVVEEIVQRVVREVQKGPYPSGTDFEYAFDIALEVLEARYPTAILVQSPGAGALANARLNQVRRPSNPETLSDVVTLGKAAQSYMQIQSFSVGKRDAHVVAIIGSGSMFQPGRGHLCGLTQYIDFKRGRGVWGVDRSQEAICD